VPDPLLTAPDVRELATRLGLRPTKTLGQNFVIDPNTVRRIVRTADVGADDVVIEVGPGLGSLTLGLLPVVSRVVAVEIDPVLAAELPSTVGARLPGYTDRLEVLTQDALRLADVPGPPPTAFVANLPYNVAVPVLLRLLERLPSLRTGLVMVQAEVADRLVAPPGSRTYGVPSVKAAWYAEVRRAGSIGRTVFWPAPHVDSGLVAFTRRAEPSGDRAAVFALVDAAFAQRRKTLRAALAGWAGSADEAERRLRAAGIDPSARGEVLGVEEFARLATVTQRASDATTGRVSDAT
jgi:16S rRNA (adenine1518-N6/adenine1519-N6)-dimethyltransferase